MMRKPTFPAAATALALFGLASAATLPALAQQPVFADRAACLARADALPDFAYEEAKLWERQGAGADARLCQALALMLRADWALAAPALEASARELEKDPRAARADLWSRAALSWSNAKQPDRAEAAYQQALTLMPGNVQILMDRAIARAGQERYWDAIADLDQVVEKAPKLSEAWLLRAQAHRILALNSKAMADVEMALKFSPQSGEALLLRGNLFADAGDGEKAKADWETARRVAPGSAAAISATDNLTALTQLEAQAKDRAKAQEKKQK